MDDSLFATAQVDCVCRLCSYTWQPPTTPRRPSSALELADCRAVARLGPLSYWSSAQRDWYRRFEPHVRPWLREEILAGRASEPRDLLYGASTLVSVGERRGLDPRTGRPRPSHSFEHTRGHELFEYIGNAGLPPGMSPALVVHGMCSLTTYLARVSALDPATVQHLAAELVVWGPRIVRYFVEENAPWYRADGTPLPVWVPRRSA